MAKKKEVLEGDAEEPERGAEKSYVSTKYPFLQIGDHVKFKDGFFSTDRIDLQELIESRGYFGVSVFPSKSGKAPAAASSEPAHQGLKGTEPTEKDQPQPQKKK